MEERTILHCDCNSFFASVETAFNPAYRNVPMAVCGSQEDRHGIVLAKNELAKRYGIVTAETVYSAKRKCPNLVIAEPHYDEYLKYSRAVNSIYSEYTDLVEPFGIDESWLDVSASRRLFGSGPEIAEEIRERVKREIGITISVGVSFNKVFAKLGSDYKKPDAVTVIDKDNFKKIVYPLPVTDMLYVGRKTADVLAQLGIRTVGELADASPTMLTDRLGKAGEMLFLCARGEDSSPVVPSGTTDAKSVGNGFTFKHDLVSREEVRLGIDFLCEEIGRRLREKGMLATVISVSIKDETLHVIQRQRPMRSGSDISREIAALAMNIVDAEWSGGRPIRTITVTASGLVKRSMSSEQIQMFSDAAAEKKRIKRRKSEETVDIIRQKHGSGAIVKGAIIDNPLGIYDPKTSK